ncbi:MAG: hypothetical protein PHP82_04055 [Candidatus ainarchaeum sp.]|nr:hypothetical protein [Candidatus ainarchaeum sp.]
MLGFILSKMQMLLFATGIFVVALMFLNFVSGIELKNITSSTLELNAQLISGQLATDSFCSLQSSTIPEFFNYGLTNNRLYYELTFSRVNFGDYKKLILSINEYGKEGIIDARSVNVMGDIFLINPSFIASSDPITQEIFDNDKISLYPRQALKGQAIAPPNAFVALKEIKSNNLSLYIIPCTTLSKSYSSSDDTTYYTNNCEENVLKVGCYLLKKEKGNPNQNDLLGQCFSISRGVVQEDYYVSKTNFSWKDCIEQGYAS